MCLWPWDVLQDYQLGCQGLPQLPAKTWYPSHMSITNIWSNRAPRWASKSSSNRCICNSRSWPMPKHRKGKADFLCRKNREAEMLPKSASASARKCGSFRDAQHNTHWWPQHTQTSWFHRSTGSPASTRPPESCVLSTLPSGQASLWFCRLQKVTTQREECKPRYIYKGSSLVRASFT